MSIADISELHANRPELYDAFSNDRDFAAQCRELAQLCPQCPTTSLELFAGPARHTAELLKSGVQRGFCVDGSPAMKSLAVNSFGINHSDYLHKWLPDPLDDIEEGSVDLFLMVRYAACRLMHADLHQLLQVCQRKASANATLFLELHKLSDVLGDFEALPIKDRATSNDVICRWPSEKPVCSPEGWLFDLNVEITHQGEVYNYNSREYIYTLADIRFMGQLLGLHIEVVDNRLIPSFGDTLMLKIRF
ncbi:hypothetical protein L1D14_21610 [Vibrio tubiashii]|uniref:hypothetical protein n=1 Tax=Vibrio tubiashii TaxID=29498 RepID=UPI001EFD7EDE|nr:hypothetical protein [Vibrio tubiashii]MCG9578810.1 hypothetical protein [Vibrio tubiashii]